MNEIDALVGLVRAVAKQRRFMQPWVDDKRFVAKGGTLRHAVDTDIITFYAAPEEHLSTAIDSREGYAQIFPEDDPILSRALARALVTQLFYRIEGPHPLLVLPPMEKEVGRVFAGMTVSADHQHKSATKEWERVKRLVSEWSAEQDAGVLLDRLDREAPTMSKFLLGMSGPSSEISRLRALLRDVRIAPLNYALETDKIPDPLLYSALAAPTDFADRVHFADIKELWFGRLLQTKSDRTSRVLVYDDAQVLARVEWVNERLDPTKYRLVLITGDSAVHTAARRYRPEGYDNCFADLYLRHPRAYLGEPGLLTPVEAERASTGDRDTASELVDWLDTFLAEFDVRGASYRAGLDELLEMSDTELRARSAPILKTHPGILREFRDRWKRYTDTVKVSLGLAGLRDDPSAKSSGIESDLKAVVGRIEVQLHARVRETWDACFEVATNLGYGFLFQQAIKRGGRARNPPALSYQTFEKADTFLKRMLASRDDGKWDKNYQSDLDALRADDPTRYTYFLAFAVLFSAEGVWRIAALLAEKAMEVADEVKHDRISGREAAYMRAVALRHCARCVADLEPVLPMLEEAEKRSKRDIEGRPDLQAGQIRFAAERPALWLTYHLFGRFCDSKLPESLPSLPQVHTELESVLNALDDFVVLAGKYHEEENVENDNKSKRMLWIARNVERNLLTNIFTIALLRCGMPGESLDRESFRGLFKRFRANMEAIDDQAIYQSFLVSSVYNAAAWWMADDAKEKRDCRKTIEQILTDPAIKENSVLPYEEQRFRFLRDLVCSHTAR